MINRAPNNAPEPTPTRLFEFRLGDVRERLQVGRRAFVVYPVFAIVALIGLSDGRQHWSLWLFNVAVLLYPVTYFICLDVALALQQKKRERAALHVSAIPLGHFGFISALAFVEILVGNM